MYMYIYIYIYIKGYALCRRPPGLLKVSESALGPVLALRRDVAHTNPRARECEDIPDVSSFAFKTQQLAPIS